MRLLVKTLFREIFLRFKITMKQVKMKKLCLRYFRRFVTVLEPLNGEIRICMFLKHCLVFAIFKPLAVGFESEE